MELKPTIMEAEPGGGGGGGHRGWKGVFLPPAWSLGSRHATLADVQWRHEDTSWLMQKTAPSGGGKKKNEGRRRTSAPGFTTLGE